MSRIVPVILSGGAGTRLWPYSVSMYPKQLLPLMNQATTMLQDTAQRLDGMEAVAGTCILVCNESHRFLAAEQMQGIHADAEIILEPAGRNTAPAVGLAACLVAETDPDTLLLVMPADHVIGDVSAFQQAVKRGIPVAEAGKLVTFGVVPTRAETGYGYIHARKKGGAPGDVLPVEAFVEKPDLATAEKYAADGEHFWNSGMFLFSAGVYLEQLKTRAASIFDCVSRSMKNRQSGDDFIRPVAADFLESPSDSVDYAIMEHTDDAMMIPLAAGWSDVGDWATLHEARESDADGNTLDGDVLVHDCSNSFISAENLLVAAVGLDNVALVQTRNAVLLLDKNRAQDIRHIVDRIRAEGRGEAAMHRQVFRQWGSFDSIDSDDGFRVKRLTVKPGAVLAEQKHAKCDKHWVVVRGRARITRNDEEFDLAQNDSTRITAGDLHSIANPFDEPAQIVEVQCGEQNDNKDPQGSRN